MAMCSSGVHGDPWLFHEGPNGGSTSYVSVLVGGQGPPEQKLRRNAKTVQMLINVDGGMSD